MDGSRHRLFAILSVWFLGAMAQAHIASAATCFVNAGASGENNGTSWADAYADLQTALGNSTCTEIWVVQGTYRPTGGTDRSKRFMLKSGVAIYGGFAGTESTRAERDPVANETILSGDIGVAEDVGDNTYTVIYSGETVDNSAILDGFTVSGGNANGSSVYGNGGGMYNFQGSPTLSHMKFTANSSDNQGGGVFNYQGSPVLTDVAFEGNAASQGGGMYNEGGNPALTDTDFAHNTAIFGGGIYNGNTTHLTMSGATFTQNTAESYAGAIYSTGSTIEIAHVVFNANSATTYYGGAMTNFSTGATLSDVVFDGNQATVGGAIHFFGGGALSVDNGTFRNNKATQYDGGAIANLSSNATLTLADCVFEDNSSIQRGGAVFAANDTVGQLTRVVFARNSAVQGGAFYNYYANTTLTDVGFDDNTSSSTNTFEGGGAFYNFYATATFFGATFSGNSSAGYGGAIFVNNGTVTHTNVTFNGNTADKFGGGIYHQGGSQTLTNVTFDNNAATFIGGAIYLLGDGVELDNVLLANSQAGVDGNCNAAVGSGSAHNLIDDDSCGLSDGVDGNRIGPGYTIGLAELADNGGFTRTQALLPASAAIDAGDDASCPAVDQRGLARPQGAHCDIGAVEYVDVIFANGFDGAP